MIRPGRLVVFEKEANIKKHNKYITNKQLNIGEKSKNETGERFSTKRGGIFDYW
jgi:hypothetical protein